MQIENYYLLQAFDLMFPMFSPDSQDTAPSWSSMKISNAEKRLQLPAAGRKKKIMESK
jgi:hypothetical protein